MPMESDDNNAQKDTIMYIYNHIGSLYNNTIRDYLPKKTRNLGGVRIRDARLLDLTADHPYYKEGVADAIKTYVNHGDTVELVGFGHGTTTVHALRAGASKVTAYEAAIEMVEEGNDTLRENPEVDPERVSVEHAIVGDPVDIWGDSGGARVVSPTDLSQADVLIMDCEGSEVSILKDLGTWPRVLIVEPHPGFGTEVDDVLKLIPDHYHTTTQPFEPNTEKSKDIVIATSQG